MLDVVSIGSALIDIYVYSDEFSFRQGNEGVLLCHKFGDKIDVDNFYLHTGGGGGNTAVGFARMGFDAGVITETGKDAWSQVIIEDLRKEFVSTSMVVSEKREQTGGSIIMVSQNGGRTVLVHRGAASMLDPHDIPEEKLSRVKWVHLSSIAGRRKTIRKIFEVIKDSKCQLSWNPGMAELEMVASGELPVHGIPAEILIVNKEEWTVLDDRHQELINSIPQIVITDGERGGETIIQGERKPFQSLRSQSVDDTGAGDAFAVGYVSAVLYDKDPDTAVRWGVQNAQSVIKHVGAKTGLLRKKHMEIAPL
jgi:sugar/nucleoside kinase (ribokinase family)